MTFSKFSRQFRKIRTSVLAVDFFSRMRGRSAFYLWTNSRPCPATSPPSFRHRWAPPKRSYRERAGPPIRVNCLRSPARQRQEGLRGSTFAHRERKDHLAKEDEIRKEDRKLAKSRRVRSCWVSEAYAQARKSRSKIPGANVATDAAECAVRNSRWVKRIFRKR